MQLGFGELHIDRLTGFMIIALTLTVSIPQVEFKSLPMSRLTISGGTDPRTSSTVFLFEKFVLLESFGLPCLLLCRVVLIRPTGRLAVPSFHVYVLPDSDDSAPSCSCAPVVMHARKRNPIENRPADRGIRNKGTLRQQAMSHFSEVCPIYM
jgi:hypothetical protein